MINGICGAPFSTIPRYSKTSTDEMSVSSKRKPCSEVSPEIRGLHGL